MKTRSIISVILALALLTATWPEQAVAQTIIPVRSADNSGMPPNTVVFAPNAAIGIQGFVAKVPLTDETLMSKALANGAKIITLPYADALSAADLCRLALSSGPGGIIVISPDGNFAWLPLIVFVVVCALAYVAYKVLVNVVDKLVNPKPPEPPPTNNLPGFPTNGPSQYPPVAVQAGNDTNVYCMMVPVPPLSPLPPDATMADDNWSATTWYTISATSNGPSAPFICTPVVYSPSDQVKTSSLMEILQSWGLDTAHPDQPSYSMNGVPCQRSAFPSHVPTVSYSPALRGLVISDGSTGYTIAIETSPDLKTWTGVSTNRVPAGRYIQTMQNNLPSSNGFFRVKQIPP